MRDSISPPRTPCACEPSNLRNEVRDRNVAELPALDGVHRIAPNAPKVARVQANEDRGRPDERALSLDACVALAQEDRLPRFRSSDDGGFHSMARKGARRVVEGGIEGGP